MIELVREAAAMFLTWCIGLTIAYGVVESSLFFPVRVWLASEGDDGWWLETLLYCPFCTGFWCWGVVGLLSYMDPWWFVRMAAIGTASLLLARSFGLELVRSWHELEKTEIEALRASRKDGAT